MKSSASLTLISFFLSPFVKAFVQHTCLWGCLSYISCCCLFLRVHCDLPFPKIPVGLRWLQQSCVSHLHSCQHERGIETWQRADACCFLRKVPRSFHWYPTAWASATWPHLLAVSTLLARSLQKPSTMEEVKSTLGTTHGLCHFWEVPLPSLHLHIPNLFRKPKISQHHQVFHQHKVDFFMLWHPPGHL